MRFYWRRSEAIALVLAVVVLLCHPNPLNAQQSPSAACNPQMVEPITHVKIDRPFDAIPTRDGCWIFVSGGPARKIGVAVLRRTGGSIEQVRFLVMDSFNVEGPRIAFSSGLVLTHDEKILIGAARSGATFLDVERLISGQGDPVLGHLSHDIFGARAGGALIVNVTSDDKYLFISQESGAAISVVDLARARASSFRDTGAIIGSIPTGEAPISLVFSPDERYLYATSQGPPKGHGWPIDCRPQGKRTDPPDHVQGAIVVIDVERAKADPASSVMTSVRAGCNPVRLALSPDGGTAYVTARTDDALLAFDTQRIMTDAATAFIGRVPVGIAPVGVAVIDGGSKVVVANSNRFAGGSGDRSDLTVIDAKKIDTGASAVLGTIPAGAFPRQMHLTADGRTLLVTNANSGTLQVIDLTRLSLQPVKK